MASAADIEGGRQLFNGMCVECHGAVKQKGDLRLDLRDKAMKSEGVIVKGKAAESGLVRRITLPKGDDEIMPNRGEPLSPDDIAKIKAWIDAGAVWPDGMTTATRVA